MWLKTNIRTLRDLEYWVEEDEDFYFREAHIELEEPFEHLPKVENRASYFNSNNLDYWDYRSYHYYKINPYTKAENIIAKNISKSYNLAYSYYLKQFPSYYVRRDIDRAWYINFEHERYRSYLPKYYIDINGLIQVEESTKPKKEISIRSDDYKVELVHKITGHLLSNFKSVYEQISYAESKQSPVSRKMWNYTKQGKLLYLHYKHQYKAQFEDFENKVISGTKITYTSKNDYRYKRYYAEKFKKSKRKTKRISIDEKEFRRLLNEKKLKDREKNLIKILSHGFDPITSFRKRKHDN